ncbi:hypothetical protein Tco_0995309 [Tanacetum coccineum]
MNPSKQLFNSNQTDSEMKLKPKMKTFSLNLMTTLLTKLDDNINKIIKDQVKEQVKAQVSKILPRIENMVNEQLKAEVMTRSSNESKTSHAVAANLSELELKKILINKIDKNKSIHRSNEQMNLYNTLVEAYESDKLILETYGETVTFKRCRDEKDKDEEPSAGSNRGQREEELAKNLSQPVLRKKGPPNLNTSATEEQYDKEKSRHPDWFQKPAKPPTPDRDWNKTLPAIHGPGRKHQQFYGFAANKESDRDVYSKRRIIAITKLQIVEWNSYKHLDWITIRKLTNLNVEDHLAFGLSENVYKKSDLKCRDAYIAYSNPRGFIYKNKDKKNKLMRIDELHKFSDGTLDDVRTALNDRLKGIRMVYLPKTIWRQSDRE